MNETYKNSQKTEHDSNLLKLALLKMPQTEKSYSLELFKTVIHEISKGNIVWHKNLIHSLYKAIANIDYLLSIQLSIIMHHEAFKKLEGSWRGVHYTVSQSETNSQLKIKILNCSKSTLQNDLQKAIEFDQSELFKKVYENEFGNPGGEPFGLLIGDYEFSHEASDVEMLEQISNIASAAFCPFITSAGVKLFGLTDWEMLSKPRDLEKIFDSQEYIKWRKLRELEDARFIVLTLPRVLARLPYGQKTQAVEQFNFEENLNEYSQYFTPMSHNNYCWMNAAYALAVRITSAFSKFGWCTAIRGAESGGRVENLPLHYFKGLHGDIEILCPTEVSITDRREAELSKLGFLPLSYYKNTDYAVFFGSQTLQKPLIYDRAEATANAAISSRLPYVMATSRFAHYLKLMGRDKIGSFMESQELEAWLNDWIINYVNGNPESGQAMKARYPLAEAQIKVENVAGKPGTFQAVTWLRPWLQLEELTTCMRLVARIPKSKI